MNALRALDEVLAVLPVLEPSPNLLAQSRMRLDEELDPIPPHGWVTRLRSNWFRWVGNVQSAPALATLLLGVGFLAGNFTHRYQVAQAPKPKPPVILTQYEQRVDCECDGDCADAELGAGAGELQPAGSGDDGRLAG